MSASDRYGFGSSSRRFGSAFISPCVGADGDRAAFSSIKAAPCRARPSSALAGRRDPACLPATVVAEAERALLNAPPRPATAAPRTPSAATQRFRDDVSATRERFRELRRAAATPPPASDGDAAVLRPVSSLSVHSSTTTQSAAAGSTATRPTSGMAASAAGGGSLAASTLLKSIAAPFNYAAAKHGTAPARRASQADVDARRLAEMQAAAASSIGGGLCAGRGETLLRPSGRDMLVARRRPHTYMPLEALSSFPPPKPRGRERWLIPNGRAPV